MPEAPSAAPTAEAIARRHDRAHECARASPGDGRAGRASDLRGWPRPQPRSAVATCPATACCARACCRSARSRCRAAASPSLRGACLPRPRQPPRHVCAAERMARTSTLRLAMETMSWRSGWKRCRGGNPLAAGVAKVPGAAHRSRDPAPGSAALASQRDRRRRMRSRVCWMPPPSWPLYGQTLMRLCPA